MEETKKIPFMIYEEEVGDYYDILGIKSKEETELEEISGIQNLDSCECYKRKSYCPELKSASYYESLSKKNYPEEYKKQMVKRSMIYKCPVCDIDIEQKEYYDHINNHGVEQYRIGIFYVIKKEIGEKNECDCNGCNCDVANEFEVVCLICKKTIYKGSESWGKYLNEHFFKEHNWIERIIGRTEIKEEDIYEGNFYCSECKEKFESAADESRSVFIKHAKEVHGVEILEVDEFEETLKEIFEVGKVD